MSTPGCFLEDLKVDRSIDAMKVGTDESYPCRHPCGAEYPAAVARLTCRGRSGKGNGSDGHPEENAKHTKRKTRTRTIARKRTGPKKAPEQLCYWFSELAMTLKAFQPTFARRRRKDDATFFAIGAVVALFFLGQLGWTILH
jgi:hypothetical protein